jgi:hypothetical protein
MANKPKLRAVDDQVDNNSSSQTEAKTDAGAASSIAKPPAFDLNRFKSKRGAAVANVETLLTALPHHPIAQARDFVRLHHNEDRYWSPELCFVNVPIKGMKKDALHLVDEDIALTFLPSGRIQRFRLALATKPHDIFFLCHIPTQNLDNSWNIANLDACEKAKSRWVQATSRKAEGIEAYKIDFARTEAAFPPPKWPTQTLEALIAVTFANGRMIDREDHPGLLRLLGDKQDLS